MSHKKRGQLTTSPEWARHLRPLLRRFFWKGERRAERVLARSAGSAVQEIDPAIDPRTAILIGTYATPEMAQIIADVLGSDGIRVSLVGNGREGAFPRLALASGGTGLFVAPKTESSARRIAGEIEEPVFHG
jgi:hypothetical protein